MIGNKKSRTVARIHVSAGADEMLNRSVIIHSDGASAEAALSSKLIKDVRENDRKRRRFSQSVALVSMALGFALFILEILYSGTSDMTVENVALFGVKVGHFTGGVGIGMLIAGALLLVSVNNYTLIVNDKAHANAGFARKRSAAGAERVG